MSVREMERFLEQWQMDARDLRRRMILSPTPREREQWYALLLLAQGWTASAMVEALERDPHTVGRWAAAFGEGGSRALIFEQTGGSPPDRGRYGVFRRGPWRVTSRLSLGSGQGSGSSQTRLQRRPRSSNRRSQSMPYRITLTIRLGLCHGQRCWDGSAPVSSTGQALGGAAQAARAQSSARLASSTLVP